MKETNKTIFDKLVLESVAAVLALVTVAPAFAGGYLSPFAITNCLQGTNVITTYPTNTFNPTNGLPQNTGHGLALGNFRSFALDFQGYLINTNAANTSFVTFMLVPSFANGGPVVTLGTNVYSQNLTNILYNDWSATNQLLQWVVPLPPLYTNYFNFATNINENMLSANLGVFSDANWIGVYQISNNVPVGDVLTNTALYLNTKLIPTPLIGQ